MEIRAACTIIGQASGAPDVIRWAARLRRGGCIQATRTAVDDDDIARLLLSYLAAPDPADAVEVIGRIKSLGAGELTSPGVNDPTFVTNTPVQLLACLILRDLRFARASVLSVAEGGRAVNITRAQTPGLTENIAWGTSLQGVCRYSQAAGALLGDLASAVQPEYRASPSMMDAGQVLH